MASSTYTPEKKIINWTSVGPNTDYKVYVITGLQWGDEGKGKLMRLYLIGNSNRGKARYCIRFNGGPNAGHTIIVKRDDPELFAGPEFVKNDQMVKFATHQLPSGVLFGIKSIIGYNCVIDPRKLETEIAEVAAILCQPIEKIQELLTIVPQAHIITPEHIAQDSATNKIGTTGSGIGPAYSAKALRTGYQVDSLFGEYPLVMPSTMTPQVIDGKHYLGHIQVSEIRALASTMDYGDVAVMEGAQGFWLDVNHGHYPYVTSSDCTIGAACSYGFLLKNIYPVGISKAYATYVGSLQMEPHFVQERPEEGDLHLLRLIAKEYGVTTGRSRQCMWLNMDLELEALIINQSKDWIINKSDVLFSLQEHLDMYHQGRLAESPLVDVQKYAEYLRTHQHSPLPKSAYNLIYKKQLVSFSSWRDMLHEIYRILKENNVPTCPRVVIYDTPESDVSFSKPIHF